MDWDELLEDEIEQEAALDFYYDVMLCNLADDEKGEVWDNY